MAEIEITDEASLEAWLKTRPRGDAEIIAFRAAARVFPLWGRAMEERWAKESGSSALLLLEYLFTDPFKMKIKEEFRLRPIGIQVLTGEKWVETISSQVAAKQAARAVEGLAISAKESIKQTLIALETVGHVRVVSDIQRISDAGREQREYTLAVISADANALQSNQNLTNLPLWPNTPPDWFTTADRETRAIWAKDPDTWAFWQKWWDGVISGDMPFPPELLRDVALIDDDIWQQGPKAVAARIDLLIQRRALRSEAAAIKTKLIEFVSLTEGLGAHLHNQPPDEELSPVKLRATLQAISEALHQIEVVLDGPEILPDVVKSLAQRLQDLWDGLSKTVKGAVTAIALGFLAAAGADVYALAKSNIVKNDIDIPSLSRRLLDFGKELEKQRTPTPVFPSNSPVDI